MVNPRHVKSVTTQGYHFWDRGKPFVFKNVDNLWLRLYRAIATRYDKAACNFFGAILLVAAVVWLN